MTSGQAGGTPGRPAELSWFKFHMSWAKWFEEDSDPNMSALTNSELGRCMREILRFVSTNATEQVSGSERWLYTEMVRDIREDWAKTAAASANRSAGQLARQADQNSDNSQISPISQISQIGDISGKAEKGQKPGESPKSKNIDRDINTDTEKDRERDEETAGSPEKEKEKIKKEKDKGSSREDRRTAKSIQEQRYDQRPNTEPGMGTVPEWFREYREQLNK